MMTASPDSLMVEFLRFLSDRPRSYRDVMEAWRTTCPRHAVWEDAVTDGLVKIEKGGRSVVLTTSGARLLKKTANGRR